MDEGGVVRILDKLHLEKLSKGVHSNLVHLKSSLLSLQKSRIALVGASIFAVVLVVAPISANFAANNEGVVENNSDFAEEINYDATQKESVGTSGTEDESGGETQGDSAQQATQNTGATSSTVRTQVSVKSSTSSGSSDQTTSVKQTSDGSSINFSATTTGNEAECEEDRDGADFEVECESEDTDTKIKFRCRGNCDE